MPSVVGIDLSSKAIDLVKLDEDSNRAEWVRCKLAGKDAWERTLSIRSVVIPGRFVATHGRHGGFWDDVYLVAIEKPVNDQQRVLMRVQGAILASLPAALRDPLHCWEVHPSTWKAALGLKRKEEAREFIHGLPFGAYFTGLTEWDGPPQDALDAYCLALYARDANAEAITRAREASAKKEAV